VSAVTRQTTSANKCRLGELLVQEGLVNEVQLEQALTEQKSRGAYTPLGEVCRELGFISRRALRDILMKYRKQVFLGDLLLKLGFVTDAQLREGLEQQVKARRKLGAILVDKGFLTQTALADSLSIQLGIDKFRLGSQLIDKTLLKGVSVAFLQKKRVLPLFYDKEKAVLTVIMEDPSDRETLEDLEKIFKARVEPTILSSGTLDNLLNEVFDVWFSAH
jgi:type IV pilus assembly protein PilB